MNGYDVRSVANIVLEEGEKAGVGVTNLHMNKVIYFMHVEFLRHTKQPLVSAKIEAWEHGPVFREIYRQFKTWGRNPILSPAKKVDFDSGETITAKLDVEFGIDRKIRELASFFVKVPAGILVDLSHETGGAWDKAWNHEEDYNVGMEITNRMIEKYELTKDKRIKIL